MTNQMCGSQPDHDGDRMNPRPWGSLQAVMRASSTPQTTPLSEMEWKGGRVLIGWSRTIPFSPTVSPLGCIAALVLTAFTRGVPPFVGAAGGTPGTLLPMQPADSPALIPHVIPSGVRKCVLETLMPGVS